MECLIDPSISIGLLTVVVLGIEKIVFITIQAGKLPKRQRDRARRIGLSLALLNNRPDLIGY